MTRIAAAIYKILTAFVRYALGKNGTFPNGSYDKSDDVFRKYITASVLIHVILVVALSITYRRAIKPALPVGPYEVSLVEMEKPKVSPPKQTTKKPEPKRPEQKKVVVPKEEKKEEEAVKIKPKVTKKPEEKKPEHKKPEQKPQSKPETKKEPEPKDNQPPSPDSLLAKVKDATPTPSVSGIQIDSPSFNFNYYLTMLQMKIQNNWNVPNGLPVSEGSIIATVKFTIRTDGTITGVDVEESSGMRFFDQSALRAVMNSNPAPPLPRAYNEDRLGVHVNFVFREEAR